MNTITLNVQSVASIMARGSQVSHSVDVELVMDVRNITEAMDELFGNLTKEQQAEWLLKGQEI